MSSNTELQDILDKRGSVYGDFRRNGDVSQALKDVMHGTENWKYMSNAQREALDMVALKISRILTGDPRYIDNWVDGAGYMQRIAQIIDEDDREALIKTRGEPTFEPGMGVDFTEDGAEPIPAFLATPNQSEVAPPPPEFPDPDLKPVAPEPPRPIKK
jgi:hypothetical protein